MSKKGWCVLHDPGSDNFSLKYFNINNCATKVEVDKAAGEGMKDIVDLGEFKLAMAVAREAMSLVNPWNKTIAAIEGFFRRSDYCKADLGGVDKPAVILTQFVDYAMELNADKWKNKEVYLTTGEVKTTWDSFFGAKPVSDLPKNKQDKPKDKPKRFEFNKGFFDDICRMYNVGKCMKPPGMCTTNRGVPLRHVCNFAQNPQNPRAVCGAFHPMCFNH